MIRLPSAVTFTSIQRTKWSRRWSIASPPGPTGFPYSGSSLCEYGGIFPGERSGIVDTFSQTV